MSDDRQSVGVSIAASGGKMETASQKDVDTGVTLCLLGGELIAYRDAILTGAEEYTLASLSRGLYATVPQDHDVGERFVRLDEALFRYAYGDLSIGTEIYVKLPSFNEFGMATQSLADVPAYTLSLQPVPGQVLGLQSGDTGDTGDISLTWTAVPGATIYTAYFYSADGGTFKRAIDTSTTAATYASADQQADGQLDGYRVLVVAENSAGAGAPATLNVGSGGVAAPGGGAPGGGGGGAQPAAVTGASAVGGGYNRLRLTCSASPDTAVTGYAFYYSTSPGFTPTGSPDRTSSTPSLTVSVSEGTWYARIAAYSATWDGTPGSLNFSGEVSADVQDYQQNCLDPATPVLLPSGEGTIGGLRAGHLVRTIDARTGAWGTHTVTAATRARVGSRLRVLLEDGRELVGTPRHRVRTTGGAWRSLEHLAPGDALTGAAPGVVASLEDAGPGTVVRVTVAGAQTYISNGILSHNIKAQNQL